ncbi:hypothetical protein PC129_g13758 [Phytophthora cactorum]|uniref:Uncharacterized protein n=1 Tax=Phytophthora cactorum TaxID=29920 RepID=A0A329SID0_9STRA|nr:hypothetical protein Pcac1_g27838 [Phytophthora cactorum]KAG2806991.1 hypothetical protein PC111_g17126 [Phytophthora cactorum]KAG2822474.1 hypothetical protein PC112_g10933 [Phytophthora cactorum]KAG2851819.1 hypothetical protein PC113_g15578 [Phytophthora cactorum]KAG2891065.1 hypothetical protein PC114_g17152 [Phytophthora cactorum]
MSAGAGTDDERMIVKEIAEGDIVCCHFPQLFNFIIGTEENLKVKATVQAQVKGRLGMDLRDQTPVKAAFEITKRLLDTISIVAQRRGYTGDNLLWSMLAVVNAISYNATKHELNFHFFARDVARRYHDVWPIPFIRKEHPVRNVHAATVAETEGDIRLLQQAKAEVGGSPASEYAGTLVDITRSMDLGKLHAFLKAKLPVPFAFEDLDSGGPQSTTSTAWELRFALEGCPRVL